MSTIRILECSIHGDVRFSPEYAMVSIFGQFDTIKNHYYNCQKKNKKNKIEFYEQPDYIVVNCMRIDCKYLNSYLKLIWLKYLESNKELIDVLKDYDKYTDMFNGIYKKDNQIDIFYKYIIYGKKSILKECEELINLLGNKIKKI